MVDRRETGKPDESTLNDMDDWWREMFKWIRGVEPQVKLTKLMESKWPKLYKMMLARQRVGIYVQALVTGLLDQNGVEVVDVECDCDCAECAVYESREDRPHDVDVLVKLGRHEVPMQVGVFSGARVHDHDDVTNKYGAVDTVSVNERDTKHVRDKIRQTPPGGITLLATTSMVSPGDDWWYEGMGEKCVVLYENRVGWIYHAGGPVDAAKELCQALGCEHIHTRSVKPRRSRNPKHVNHMQFHPKTVAGLVAAVRKDTRKWTGDPDGVVGALYYPAFARAYFDGLRNAGDAIQSENLAPVLRHVVDTHLESVADGADDEEDWRNSLSGILQTLEELAKDNNTTFTEKSLVEICRVLCGIAARRYDDERVEVLWIDSIDRRLHLKALYCLTQIIINKLGDKTPPDILDVLTAAAKLGGQDGREHRIVLGYALLGGLREAIPDWYDESLLFGEAAPPGMNSVLMRVCSHTTASPQYDVHNPVFVTMKKHPMVARVALADEMRSMLRIGHEASRNEFMRLFMRQVLHGTDGYDVTEVVQYLTSLGDDAVSVAGCECGWLVAKCVEATHMDRGVKFWECVLDSTSEPAALSGFGWWALAESIDRNTWERLMLRTCDAAGGLVDAPTHVIERAAADGEPTNAGIRIIKLAMHANEHLSGDLALLRILNWLKPDLVEDVTDQPTKLASGV